MYKAKIKKCACHDFESLDEERGFMSVYDAKRHK